MPKNKYEMPTNYMIMRRDEHGSLWFVGKDIMDFAGHDGQKVIDHCKVLCGVYRGTDYVVIADHTHNIVWDRSML